MALGVMAILFAIIFIITLVSMGILIYKQGKLVKNNKKLFIAIQIYGVLVGFIYITGLPSNYILKKIIGLILIILNLTSYQTIKKDFDIGRNQLALSILLTNILLF